MTPGQPSQPVLMAEDIACPACGYDLRGIASKKCPECGSAVDREKMSISRIPWEHSREIGLWRAYWRTNLMVMLRPRLLAEEMNRPVSFRRARKFQIVTCVLAWLPTTAWAFFGYYQYTHRFWTAPFPEGNKLGWLLEGVSVFAGMVAIWLFLLGASGAASYFFHPGHMPVARQNRAITISFYACAPLAWLWLPAGLIAIGLALDSRSAMFSDPYRRACCWLVISAIAFSGAIGIPLWPGNVVLMRRCTHCSSSEQLVFGLGLPVCWVLLFYICCGLVAAVVLASLMILSLV